MSVGTPVAADVPSLFDLVLNGQGYVFLRTIDTSLPFRTQRAKYGRTPTFVERSNTSAAYGDNSQDFFLTASQNNWVNGEQQRFAHASIPDTLLSSWQLTGVDASVPGQVALRKNVNSVTAATAITAGCSNPWNTNGNWLATTTKLYNTTNGGASLVDNGVHGLGAAPKALSYDSGYVYLTTTAGGTVGVRRWNGAAYATWSATAADAIQYHNNSIYGVVASTGVLNVYSTAGVVTAQYTWKDGAGSGRVLGTPFMCSYGGKLIIGESNYVWQFDGATVSLIAELPTNFAVTGLTSVLGVLFVSGIEYRPSLDYRPAVYTYTSGTLEKLWAPQTWSTSSTVGYTAVVPFGGGAVWNDDVSGRLMFWEPGTGAVSAVGSYTVAALASIFTTLVACKDHISYSRAATTAYYYPDTATVSSGTVVSSLFDFDNSLTKQIRGIKVDFDSGTDGNGGTVDIAYRVGDVDGSYTSLQTGAVSGTEYTLSGVSGRSISAKVTLNKGTSTSGPILKRVYVRASPILQSYRSCEYILDCSGRDGRTPAILNDNNTPHPLDGLAMAQNLNTALTSTSPISITDRFGTFNGVVEPSETEIIEVQPEEYIARVVAREV